MNMDEILFQSEQLHYNNNDHGIFFNILINFVRDEKLENLNNFYGEHLAYYCLHTDSV